MSRKAQGKLRMDVDISELSTGQGTGNQTPHVHHGSELEYDLESGTQDGQIDRVYSAEVSLTTSPTSIDVSGALAGVLTGTVVLVELVGIRIRNKSAAGNVLVGGGSNQVPKFDTTFKNPIGPGGCLMAHDPAGIVVTAGTGDILTLTASAGTVVADVELWGRSA